MRRDKQKENIMSSENQSMLVSERKPVVVDNIPKSYPKCDCLNSLKNIQSKLQLFGYRLDEMNANINICFTKQMETYGKIVDQQKKRQNIEYTIWESKQINEAIRDKLNTQLIKQQQCMSNLSQEVQTWSRVLRDIKNWKSNYTNWSAELQKKTHDNFKNYRTQIDSNMKKMFQAVEQIGLLQRKMIQKSENTHSTQPDKKSRAISYNEKPMMGARKSMGHNQSTMVYSRQYYK